MGVTVPRCRCVKLMRHALPQRNALHRRVPASWRFASLGSHLPPRWRLPSSPRRLVRYPWAPRRPSLNAQPAYPASLPAPGRLCPRDVGRCGALLVSGHRLHPVLKATLVQRDQLCALPCLRPAPSPKEGVFDKTIVFPSEGMRLPPQEPSRALTTVVACGRRALRIGVTQRRSTPWPASAVKPAGFSPGHGAWPSPGACWSRQSILSPARRV